MVNANSVLFRFCKPTKISKGRVCSSEGTVGLAAQLRLYSPCGFLGRTDHMYIPSGKLPARHSLRCPKQMRLNAIERAVDWTWTLPMRERTRLDTKVSQHGTVTVQRSVAR